MATSCWIGLHEPTEEEFDSVKREFGLHELAVEDAIHAHQRPKMELYDDTVFLVLKTARYVDSEEVITLGEILIFVGRGFVVTVRHGSASSLARVREDVERKPELLKRGPAACSTPSPTWWWTTTSPRIEGLDEDITEVENEVFSEDAPNRAERIYKLKREVLEFLRAAAPLTEPIDRLAQPRGAPDPPEVRAYFRDVNDHLLPGAGPARELPRPADQRAGGQPAPARRAPERGHAQDLRLGGHRGGAHHDRRHLRHELPAHARAGVAPGLPGGAGRDARGLRVPVPPVQRAGWL